MTGTLEPTRPVSRAVWSDTAWDHLSTRYGQLLDTAARGFATELDLAELDATRTLMDELLERLR